MSCYMASCICVVLWLYIWCTIWAGMAIWCFLEIPSCLNWSRWRWRIDYGPKYLSKYGLPPKSVCEVDDTSATLALTILWRSLDFIVNLNWFRYKEYDNDPMMKFYPLPRTVIHVCWVCTLFWVILSIYIIYILPGLCEHGYSWGRVGTAANNDTIGVISISSGLIWKFTSVCCAGCERNSCISF